MFQKISGRQLRALVSSVGFAGQLAEEDLIEWAPLIGANGQAVAGTGQIKVRGVRVIEGTEKPPVGFVVNNINNHNSPGANLNFGNGNIHQQAAWLESASQKIDVAAATSEEKTKGQISFGKNFRK